MNIIVKFPKKDRALINYTNWEGATSDRFIEPLYIWFGATEYHKTPQFLLNAIDLEKNAERNFAMHDIHSIYVYYNPLNLQEDFYHPLSPQKDYTFTYRSGDSMIERSVEQPYNPVSQLPDFFLNSISELVQEDYIFDPAAARGAGSRLEKLPTEEDIRVSRLKRLKEKLTPDLLKETIETLRMVLNIIGRADFEEGYCCCGSPNDTHGLGDGHSPVDAGIYYNQVLPMQRIDELLAKLTSE